MLRNYLKIAVRNLLKHKSYSFINIAGLAVGMACCILILLYIRDELSYDRFHQKADRIYRVVASNAEDGQPTNANGAFSVGPALRKDFPEIVQAVRFRKMGWGQKRVFARGSQRFYEQRFFFVDPQVFEVFDFRFLSGDPKTALLQPLTIVLTEEMAQKYFPDCDPIDRFISLDPYNDGNFKDFKITGVLENIPQNSHIKFDFLASFSSQLENPAGWGWTAVFTYVLLAPEADLASLESKFAAFLENYFGPNPWYSIGLQPLRSIRLHSHLKAELEPNADIAYVYIFTAIALFILLIACINFMNLATARSAKRAREVGLRKVFGAYRLQLIKQFLGEAILLSVIAVGLALVLVEFLLPVLNSVLAKQLNVNYLDDAQLLWGMAAFTLAVGVLAGSYPAFFISGYSPVDAFTNKPSGGPRDLASLRKGLVVFQFAVSICLMVCTAIVYKQMQHVRNTNLGFARHQILILPLNNEIRKNYAATRNQLKAHPNIVDISVSEQVPARAGNGATYFFEGYEEPVSMHRLFVDHRFLATYGIELTSGRGFSEQFASDSTQAFIINEKTARGLGFEEPGDLVGNGIKMQHAGVQRTGRIIGVTEDFNLFSLRREVTSVVMSIQPLDQMNFLSIRMASTNISETLSDLQKTWQRLSPSYPFDYYFLDADFARLHRADQQLGQAFQYFAVLAILVANLGLFGLATFTAEQRTKEIGMRKVLGASIPGIFALLSKEFTKWVLLANLLAWPVAYFGMSNWLREFAFRADLGWGVFVFSAFIAVLIALLTVSLQTVKAAVANPIESLRYE